MSTTDRDVRLRLYRAGDDGANIAFEVEAAPRARLQPGQVRIAVAAAAVNPSDVKAAIGMMPAAIWPRTPGRDFAGTIVEGPAALVGREVWGSSGELGISADGSHASHLVLDADCVVERPSCLSPLAAGAAGVPFVTAWVGLKRAGLPGRGSRVAVLGANGKVGQAAMQLAVLLGADVIGVMRGDAWPDAPDGVTLIDAEAGDVAAAVRDATAGRGVDLVFNTVGAPYFEAASLMLAMGGTQLLIGTTTRVVPFDILNFYRGDQQFVGINTLAINTRETVSVMRELSPWFEDGRLRPFPVGDRSVYPFERATEAYARVHESARDRIVLVPG